MEEAVEQCLQGIHFARQYLDVPFLISYLISMANMQTHTTSLNKIVSGRTISTETLSRIMQELDIESWRTGFENSLRSELTYIIDTGMALISGNNPEQEFGFREKKSLWLLRPLVKRDLRIGLLYWQTLYLPPAGERLYRLQFRLQPEG